MVLRLGETALVLRLGETAMLHLREGVLQVQVVVLSRVVAPVIRGLVRRRTARKAPAEVPRHVVRSVTQGPNARTLRELKRLGLHTKGERQDIAHKDEFVYFVRYAYAA